MPTPTFVPYITVTQFINAVDQRQVLMYVTDTGTPATVADLTNSSTAAYAKITQLIQEACGLADMAAMQGQRYTKKQLYDLSQDAVVDDPLAGNSQRVLNGAPFRRWIIEWCWGLMFQRRRYNAQDFAAMVPLWKWVEETRERLEQGYEVFDTFSGADVAGLPDKAQLGINSTVTRQLIQPSRLWGCIGPGYETPGQNGGNGYGC